MLSAAMMVKDEATMLPGCLDSIEDVVDEVVIVDTGSTDRTVEIAESYGAKVYHHEWTGDFSLHRNQSFGYANGDWILCIDADERLDGMDGRDIHGFISQWDKDEISYAMVRILSEAHNGGLEMSPQPRFFRQGSTHWYKSIHNAAIIDGTGQFADLQLYHLGYNLSPEKAMAKYKSREELIRQYLEENPEDPMMWHSLVRNLRAQSRNEEVLSTYEEFLGLDLEPHPGVEQIMFSDAAAALICLDRIPEAETMLVTLLEKYPYNLDGYYEYGNLLGANEKYEEAIEIYKKYLLIRERMDAGFRVNMINVSSWGSRVMAYFSLGVAYFKLKRMPEAIQSLLVAEWLDEGAHEFVKNTGRKVLGRLIFDIGELEKFFPDFDFGGD